MQYQRTRKIFSSPELWLGFAAAIAGMAGVWYIYSLGLVKELTDAYAHLNFSRMMFESLTPGISQIGLWPPLLHMLMAPFTMIRPLYESGLAGAVVLIPFYILGTVYTYKLVKLFTQNEWLSVLGAVLFMANPYVIYYSAVPMMEVLFLANLMAVAYYMARWYMLGNLSSLVLTGVFAALAALSRFEGLILAPLVGILLAIDLLRRRKGLAQTQAVLILFLLLAALGPLVILAYSWYFGGSPMAFTGGDWVKSAAADEGFLTQGSYWQSLRYSLYAAFYMVGQNLIIFALATLPLLFLFRKRFEVMSVLLVLASPAIFIIIALASGSYNIGVPDLPPHTVFLNERYGLSWIGFVIVSPLLLMGTVLSLAVRRKYLYRLALAAVILGASAMLYSAGDFLYAATAKNKFFAVRNNINSPRAFHIGAGEFLNSEYDFGKILITRADNDPVLATSQIPLSNYIYEANYLYFDQAVEEPWIFARWVVMNREDPGERLASQWAENEQFASFYELAYENIGRAVYKVKDDAVRSYAIEHQLDAGRIPSINSGIAKWDPSNVYDQLQIESGITVKKN